MKTLITATVLLCVFASTASAQKYEDLLQGIETETHSTPNIYDLCMSDSFVELNGNPEKYWDDFIIYIQKDDTGIFTLSSAIIAMQGLTTNRYADLSEECIDLYLNGKIDEKRLHYVLFPICIAGTHMIQFRNKKVVRVLNKALSAVPDQYFAREIKNALSGQAFYEYIAFMQDFGYLPLDCNRIE